MRKSRYKDLILKRRRRPPPMPAWLALLGHALGLGFVGLTGLAVSNLIAWSLHAPQYLTFGPVAGAFGLFYLRSRRRSRWVWLAAMVLGIMLLAGTTALWTIRADLALERPHVPHKPR